MEQCISGPRGRRRLLMYAMAALCAALTAAPAAAAADHWLLNEPFNAQCTQRETDQYDNVHEIPCTPCDKTGYVIVERDLVTVATHMLTKVDDGSCTYETMITEGFAPACGVEYQMRLKWLNSDGTIAALGQARNVIIDCATTPDEPSDPQSSGGSAGGVEGIIGTLWDSVGILFSSKEMTPNSDGSIPNKAQQWETRMLWAGDTFTELMDNPGIFIGSQFLPYLIDQFGWLMWILFLPALAFEAAVFFLARRKEKNIVYFGIEVAKTHLIAGKWLIENLYQILGAALMMLVPIFVLAFKFLWNMSIGALIGSAWKLNQTAFKFGSDIRKGVTE